MTYAYAHCQVGIPDEHGMVTVSGKCRHSDTAVVLIVPQDGIDKWQNGTPTADAFPGLPAADRDFLDHGFCERTWASIHGAEDGEGSETD